MKISSQFDAGSIIVRDIHHANNMQLSLRQDNASEFTQWFYF